MATWTLEVRGMHCAGCAGRLDKVLGAQPGVREARVEFLKGTVTFDVDTGASQTGLAAAVEGAGFVAGAWRDDGSGH
jgi:Cu2+-exporting ATPase